MITPYDFSKFMKFNYKLFKYPILLFFKIFKISEINSIIKNFETFKGVDFVERVIEHLGVELIYDKHKLQKLLCNKQIIVISNHPFGIIDGLALIKIFNSFNNNFKIVIHSALKLIKPISSISIFVSPIKNKKAHKYKFRDTKKVLNHIKNGGSLILFPAGRVAKFDVKKFQIIDVNWDDSCLRILSKSNSIILPVFISGRNSIIFHVMNFFSENLGFLFVMRETLSKNNRKLKITLGNPVESNDIPKENLKDYFTNKVFSLAKKYE